jgi:hypothetical protein
MRVGGTDPGGRRAWSRVGGHAIAGGRAAPAVSARPDTDREACDRAVAAPRAQLGRQQC